MARYRVVVAPSSTSNNSILARLYREVYWVEKRQITKSGFFRPKYRIEWVRVDMRLSLGTALRLIEDMETVLPEVVEQVVWRGP